MPTVMITGAKRGIGRGLTDRFLEAGWDVIAAGRQIAEAEVAKLDGVSTVDLELADDHSINAAAAALSGRPIDLLVNNAGVSNHMNSALGTISRDGWLTELSVNTVAPIFVTRALLPNLRMGSRKQIAMMSSKMGSIADNASGGSYIYRSSKAALNAALKSLSHDLSSDGFTCVTLHPGWVQTDMGGPSAAITVDQSTTGLFAVLNNLSADQNGGFYNFDGTELPW
ncbi:MAG: SDR family oxidoreductase [Pseudomonadota bacterium]